MRKYFGTDGVRGVANSELTCELAYKLGRAGGYVLKGCREKFKVIIGKDTRISGDMLEGALMAGIMSVGGDVVSVGVVPTPAVAYLTRKYEADCGIVISASHNPYEYNGIKFFNSEGFKLADEIEHEIERYIEDMSLISSCSPTGEEMGRRVECNDAARDYANYLKSIVKTDFSGLKVVLDCANGAAFEVAPIVFWELGAEIVVINDKPDGKNINVNCGSTHPQGLKDAVLENKANIGLAYDGDADRLIAVDEKGEVVNGDFIMAICADSMKKKGQLKKDTLVVTVMTNLGLHVASKERGFDLVSTQVGDRYVLEEMVKGGYNLGGEQSGHMIFLDHNTTGDGTLSSLVLTSVIVDEKKPLSQLAKIMEEYPQVLINARVKNENKHSYMENDKIRTEIEKMEAEMDGQGRVLIRPSGTEPLVRVMLEGKDQEHITGLAKELASLIESTLG